MAHASTLELLRQRTFKTKFRAGGYYVGVECVVVDSKIRLNFGYNKDLLDEVKTRFEGRKWLGFDNGPKAWEIPITQRNLFQFEELQGKHTPVNPYTKWDKKRDYKEDIAAFCASRAKPIRLYNHQLQMINHALNVGLFLWAAEMGVGKSLAAIILMEMCGLSDFLWVGPKSPLVAVKNEFRKWQSPIQPLFVTYDGLKQLVEKWPSGKMSPQVLILDEVSRCKTPTAQRSIAARHIADNMRQEHGEKCFVGGLSGSPAPKSPADWWFICEIIAPGFIREGNWHLFRERLGVFTEEESIPGAGKYKKLVSWKDNTDKCGACGQVKVHANHSTDFQAKLTKQTHEIHEFVQAENEVAKLSKRLGGLVGVWLKKDCLDLPAKRYRIITCKPSRSLLNAAKLITSTTRRSVDALIRLRTLSDGFQYNEVKVGEEICSLCKGRKETIEWYDAIGSLTPEEVAQKLRFSYAEDDNGVTVVTGSISCDPQQRSIVCPNCDGTGLQDVFERQITEVTCPKDDVTVDLLDENEEIGRLNIYGGFTGSIDRIVRICQKRGWETIRVDGRGWDGRNEKNESLGLKDTDLLHMYQEGHEYHPNVAFIGQPQAAGMGLTLTAAPMTFFFSNDFNSESRIQAEDRGHRPGMDIVRGGWIVDCVHLASDQHILTNLKLKRDLQHLSMVGLNDAIQEQLSAAE